MKRASSVEEYIESGSKWTAELNDLRRILLKTEFIETLKWGIPTYTVNGKNVAGIAGFKDHFGIWFFNGVFLKDEEKVLMNAQEGKTKAMRQWRFKSIDELDEKLILKYAKEAIENQKLGKEIKPERKKKETIIPKELEDILKPNLDLKKCFDALSPYKQREYCEYIGSAKRESTKQTRLDKIIPMILEGKGLNDKYKNC
ncbi:MAG: hypothetical protein EX254_05565 [Flavobacteriaceae bacterium]|nr:hypothetical protein [Flavobacteriaceae bacterium]NNK28861.1 hypothetical protein [Flavobacteriaceae bacterium]RZV65441.1 MAG: hypothetical protein EX254_05565 [Flavobacteriaceae bacterium]